MIALSAQARLSTKFVAHGRQNQQRAGRTGKWPSARWYAYNLIEEAEVDCALLDSVRNCAQNECAARELAKVVDTEDRAGVIKAIVAKGNRRRRSESSPRVYHTGRAGWVKVG